eukprot:7908549-Pyramimonas_sp.AAC.1
MLGQKTSKPPETSPHNCCERDRENIPGGLLRDAETSALPETSSQSARVAKDVGTENKQTA